jgi:hypothetical protein
MTTSGHMTSARTFVGRVGGIAIALGVDAAAVGGIAVGWADPGSPDTDRGRTAAQSSAHAPSPPPKPTTPRSSARGPERPTGSTAVIDISDIVLDVPLRAIP